MPVSNGDLSFDAKEAHHPMTASEEKVAIQAILEAAEAQVKEGDKYYLVSYRWWKQWTAYVGEETSNNNSNDPVLVNCLKPPGEATVSSKRPSSIDNSDLVINRLQEDNNSEIELRDTLSENHDYVLLPEQVWEAFYKWYGGGPALARKVIKIGSTHQDGLAVEVYPLRLRLTVTPNGSQLIVRLSKMDTVGELCQRARELFNLGSQKIRIWDYFGKTKHALMNDPMQTLQDAELQMDHDVLLEEQVGGSWPDDSCSLPHENGYSGKELALVPVEPCRSSFSIAGGPTGSRTVISPSSEQFFSYPLSNLSKDLDGGFGLSSTGVRTGPLGLTGLQNLGNTCFMNSALQCLAHTPQLVEFFLQDYSQEINRQNPLGMEGELAIAFGELLRKLWAPGRAPVAPRSFKAKLARFAPQFSGYNQHDSQELLAFLLDGLHEDLNRVKLKPYIEAKDTDGRPDQEVALENWENHKARNDSIIVDICQGQYKSTLVCPVCSKVSVTFDPFMYLSLPLPSTSSRTITVRVISSDGSAPPIPYTVTVPKQGRCRDLIQAIGKACNLRNDERILLAELYNHRHFRLLEDPLDWLGPVCDDDHVAAYRIPKTSEKPPLLVFMNRRLEEDPINSQGTRQLKSFGAPLLACLPEQGLCTGQDLLDIFETLLKPLLKAKHLEVSQSSADKERKKNGMIDHTDEDEEMLGQESCLLKAEISLDDISVGENINGFGSGMNGSSQQHPQLFQLWFIEEKSMGINVAIESDKPLPATFSSARWNSRIQIAVDWSEKSIATYDIKQLEAMPEVYKSGFPAKKVRQEAVSLYTCLEAFLKEEPLGPEDMWYCPLCKEHRQASKKLDLWRLPEILVVHLKRFSYSRYLKNKLETFVNFPIHDLDLTKYISRTDGPLCHLYELYAVSNHYGSMGGGHYTAYAKLIDDNRWYNFDDSHVALVGEDEIKTAAAYVLFYRRIRTENSAMSNGGPILFENGAISNGGSILMMHKHH